MAKQVVCKSTCDRCKKPYDESAASAAQVEQGFGKQPPLLILESTIESAVVTVRFEDLCAKCKTRVADLIGQIRLDKDADSTNNAGATETNSETPKDTPKESSAKEADAGQKQKNPKPAASGTTH
jgi:hypothetical protein